MNWAAIAFDWNQARAFLATAEEGSLSAAARALRLTQPTVGRQIAALEADLGVILFERAGRTVRLTETGLGLVEHVRAMAEAAVRISLGASGSAHAVEGRVRITASDMMCARTLPPALPGLAERAPLLQIELVADNRIRDLLQREADIAIRHVRPQQPDLIARLVREETAHFYAASRYLDRRGRPAGLQDLAGHDFIGFGDDPRMLEHLHPLGVPIGLKNFRFGSDSGVAAWEMLRQGLGIAVMSDEIAGTAPGLERLVLDMEPIRFPVWLVTHRELHTSRRIRVVFDFLADFLSAARRTARSAVDRGTGL